MKAEERASLRRQQGPEAPRADLEARAKAVLDELMAELEPADEPPPRVPWIFRRLPDRELRLQQIVELLDEAERRGRASLAAELIAEDEPDQCACRCRLHGRSRCALCLAVERCPAHSAVDA